MYRGRDRGMNPGWYDDGRGRGEPGMGFLGGGQFRGRGYLVDVGAEVAIVAVGEPLEVAQGAFKATNRSTPTAKNSLTVTEGSLSGKLIGYGNLVLCDLPFPNRITLNAAITSPIFNVLSFELPSNIINQLMDIVRI
ncbi:hypothetical protein D915_006809 [Fasciola hepatica]|uniref:Uncharacterized protein n=1 Tax=Fasciola hepatica TaxID=6192 RepID=A0A4E0R6F3_FASHE|nr:hypothetical protein D915_006809 [Fasciola hepatica]